MEKAKKSKKLKKSNDDVREYNVNIRVWIHISQVSSVSQVVNINSYSTIIFNASVEISKNIIDIIGSELQNRKRRAIVGFEFDGECETGSDIIKKIHNFVKENGQILEAQHKRSKFDILEIWRSHDGMTCNDVRDTNMWWKLKHFLFRKDPTVIAVNPGISTKKTKSVKGSSKSGKKTKETTSETENASYKTWSKIAKRGEESTIKVHTRKY